MILHFHRIFDIYMVLSIRQITVRFMVKMIFSLKARNMNEVTSFFILENKFQPVYSLF